MTTAAAFWYGVSVGAAGLVVTVLIAGIAWGVVEDIRTGGRINRPKIERRYPLR